MTVSKHVKPSDSIDGAKGVPYYTPAQPIPAGTFIPNENDSEDVTPPPIFTPLKIGKLTLQNRMAVSPMCMYSSDNFEVTPFHMVHYGAIAVRGAGLIIVESTSVSQEGGLSPRDLGLWTDRQAEKIRDIVKFIHSQGQLCAIQLGHGGRKASGQPPYLHLEQVADESVGGWPGKTVAPSAIEYRPHGNLPVPQELSKEDIRRIIKDFGAAAKRAIEICGFDAIEIHGAHGYLIHQFYSQFSNRRTDEYGGSYENRIRFLLEIIDEIQANIPEDIPIFLRISSSDNVKEDNVWHLEDSLKLIDIVIEKGIKLIDVSSGGNVYNQTPRTQLNEDPDLPPHLPIARAIKKHVGDRAAIACVGDLSKDAATLNGYIKNGDFDLALIGKGFLKNPGLVWEFADQLGIRVTQALQYDWGHYPNIHQILELVERTKRLMKQ